MEEIRFSHLHGLQRQRPQGRSADEVLKHIFSAKRHLQAAGASYYINYIALSLLLKEGLDMTNMNVIPVSQDSYIVNGCKVKITYAEDGDSMEVLQKLIHDTLCEEAKNYS